MTTTQTAARIRTLGTAITDLLDAAAELDAADDSTEAARLRIRASAIAIELAAQRMTVKVRTATAELREALQAWAGSRA